MRIKRWIGDSPVIDSRKRAKQMEATVSFLESNLNASIARFGIPESWMRISYRSTDELRRKERELQEKAAPKGLLYDSQFGAWKVNYNWLIADSKDALKPAAQTLLGAAKEAGYKDHRDLIGAVASLVQSMTYKCRFRKV